MLPKVGAMPTKKKCSKGVYEMKWNESGVRPPLCPYRLNWARWDGEMIEMILSSRHRIRNTSPGGLRPSTLRLGHGGFPQNWLSHVDGEETFLLLSNRRDREPNPELAWKAAVLTTTLWPPPRVYMKTYQYKNFELKKENPGSLLGNWTNQWKSDDWHLSGVCAICRW